MNIKQQILTDMTLPGTSGTSNSRKRQYSFEESDDACAFSNKSVKKEYSGEDIFLKKTKDLYSNNRSFSLNKYSDKLGLREITLLETPRSRSLPERRAKSSYYKQICDNISDVISLAYMSKGNEENFNGKVSISDELVVCRQLAIHWLMLEKFNYDDISSKERIKNCKELFNDSILKKSFNGDCPAEGIYFERDKLNEALYSVAITLKEGQEKRYYLSSGIHAMGLYIKKNKDNNIIIYYYDPNDTLRHMKIIIKTKNDLKRLNCHKIWFPEVVENYFEKNNLCSMHSLETKESRDECQVTCIANLNKELIYRLCLRGHYGHPMCSFDFKDIDKGTLKDILAGKIDVSNNVIPALYIACEMRRLEAIKAFYSTVCRTDLKLDAADIKELLGGISGKGTSALRKSYHIKFYEAFTALLEQLCKDDLKLDNDAKEHLLSGSGEDNIPILLNTAFEENNLKFITLFTTSILSSNLNLDLKVKLLLAMDSKGEPILFKGFCGDKKDAVSVFLHAILNSDIPMHSKEELISKKGKLGLSGLQISLILNNYETVKEFLHIVLSSDFDTSAKVRLLLAENSDGTLEDKLSLCTKQSDACKLFVEMVGNSKALLDSEKDLLLEPFREHYRS